MAFIRLPGLDVIAGRHERKPGRPGRGGDLHQFVDRKLLVREGIADHPLIEFGRLGLALRRGRRGAGSLGLSRWVWTSGAKG